MAEDNDDQAQQLTLRADFRSVSQLIDRALVYGKQFRKWNHQDWSHLKNQEDFDRIFHHPPEQRIAIESVYGTGRDMAVSVEVALYAFAEVGECPTFKSYVDGVEERASEWAEDLRATVDRAKPIFAQWPQYYSVSEMLALAAQQIEMAAAIRAWANMARRTPLYCDEAGLSPAREAPANSEEERFELQGLLGGGNYGEVHKAFDRKMKRTVALKYVSQGIGNGTALDHARAMSRLNHPNVAVVYEVLADQRQPETHELCDVVVMELVEGSSLEERLMRSPMSPNEVIVLCRGLVNAVEYLQQNGFVHGDLHEGNVMLAADGPKIIDVMFDAANTRSTAMIERRLQQDIQLCRLVLHRVLRSARFDAEGFLQETWSLDTSTLRTTLERVLGGGHREVSEAAKSAPPKGSSFPGPPPQRALAGSIGRPLEDFEKLGSVLNANEVGYTVSFEAGGSEPVRTTLLAVFEGLALHMQREPMNPQWAARAATVEVTGNHTINIKEDAELDRAFRGIFADLQGYGLLAVRPTRGAMGNRPKYELTPRGEDFFAHRRRTKVEARAAVPQPLRGVEWVKELPPPPAFPTIEVDE